MKTPEEIIVSAIAKADPWTNQEVTRQVLEGLDAAGYVIVGKLDVEHLEDAIGRANGSEKGLHQTHDDDWSQGYAGGCQDTQTAAVYALQRSEIYKAAKP
ncbi:MAG: hypothetical protein ACR2QF_09315 [Geminicoccaceae bacterium]